MTSSRFRQRPARPRYRPRVQCRTFVGHFEREGRPGVPVSTARNPFCDVEPASIEPRAGGRPLCDERGTSISFPVDQSRTTTARLSTVRRDSRHQEPTAHLIGTAFTAASEALRRTRCRPVDPSSPSIRHCRTCSASAPVTAISQRCPSIAQSPLLHLMRSCPGSPRRRFVCRTLPPVLASRWLSDQAGGVRGSQQLKRRRRCRCTGSRSSALSSDVTVHFRHAAASAVRTGLLADGSELTVSL